MASRLADDETDDEVSGARKAAILLVAVGTEVASEVLRTLHDSEVERISIEIAKLRNVSSELVESVLLEYRDMAMAHDYITQGGISFARRALENALGPRRAEEIIMKIEAAMQVSAFHLLQTVETSQLSNFLQNEHPQTAALILAHLNPRKAADIISNLNQELQNEIMFRLATMGKTSPELLRDIEEVIRDQIGSVIGTELSATGGVEKVAEILNNTSRTSERSIMEGIRERDPELATNIKSLMFVFDDLVNINDRDLQRLLVEVDQKDLVLALKGSSPDLQEKLLRNVSERAAAMIKEELELMGQVRVRDVEEAQRRILEVAHALEEQEEIALTRTNDAYL
ncbi:flagellar motor switch protein FliG [Rhodocaloribacter litoris]|uniref:flagellar motor switch protein FliG n=1 Tax=Rhodocaloribacter litoris TaxID=2558931 RepID=UPI001E2A7B1F|nr:flagellar motor switch protein FliG [Rhodocaloribacter litoris]